jgi:glutamine synthetase adenylyltransferase
VSDLAERLEASLAGTPLAARLPQAAASFLERRAHDAAARRLDGPLLGGLARLLASEPRQAGFLAHRPALLERLAAAREGSLAARARELDAGAEVPAGDLEDALDALRLLRREETCLAACLDLAGLAPFEEVSTFLSVLAESITRRALALAARGAGAPAGPPLCVVAMGKLAGREFTYHSDLDLIFLYAGRAEDIERPSRVGQRLIAYLSTMTGAGVAYAVDARLRPSGQQGTLVTTFEGFERYQTCEAQTWEHVALLRARPIAGDAERGAGVLARVREQIFGRAEPPWAYLAPLRRRVERERANESDGSVAFKTGPGGLMDADFLAAGALLERPPSAFPRFPSVPAMLGAGVQGKRVDALIRDYRFLRLLEARSRWCAGRGVEVLDPDPEQRTLVAALLEPHLDAAGLARHVAEVRGRLRQAWSDVVRAGSIAALE